MSTSAVTTVLQARAAANEWLVTHLPDRFAAGIPEYDGELSGWRVPVWLSYPGLEPFGPLGEVVVDELGTVSVDIPPQDMKNRAAELYEQHLKQIEAPLL